MRDADLEKVFTRKAVAYVRTFQLVFYNVGLGHLVRRRAALFYILLVENNAAGYGQQMYF